MKKFWNVGFRELQVVDHRGFGLDDLARYPLFAPDFLAFLRRLMPPERHAELVFAIVITARKPERGNQERDAEDAVTSKMEV